MTEEFSDAEVAEFIRLLQKIRANDHWVPTLTAWQEVQRTFSRWAVELVITRKNKAGVPTIYLSRYTGEGVPHHAGLFHINGGFEKSPETIRETCSRVVRDELEVDVIFRGVLGIHKWTLEESPIKSRMLSIYVACDPLSDLPIRDDRRFFTRAEMLALGPTDMAPNHPHRAFISDYLEKLESGAAPTPVPFS